MSDGHAMGENGMTEARVPPDEIGSAEGALDRTALYRRFLAGDSFDGDAIERAFATIRPRVRTLRVVVAPSYLVGFILPARRVRLLDYFSHEERWLADEGIEVAIADLNPVGTVEENAGRLGHLVRASQRPVAIVSHSKGGLDTLTMLLGAGSSVRDKVACWIAEQTPFHGSPVADRVRDSRAAPFVVDPLLRLLGGSERSLDDLTTAVCRMEMTRRRVMIADLARALPILSVATYSSVGDRGAVFGITRSWMERQGLRNDGLVPVESQILPHAPYVIVPGLEHAGTITSRPFRPRLDRKRFLKLLFVLALTPPD